MEETGIVGYVVEQHRADLYPLLEQIVKTTRLGDLHRYAVIQMAAARDRKLTEILFGLAKLCPLERVGNFIEALDLVSGSEEVVKVLRGRRK